jgi:hypothetical protein
MASSPGDLSSMVSQNYNNGVVMGFINTMDPKKTHEALRYLQEYIEEHRNEEGLNKIAFGYRGADEVADSKSEIREGIGGFLGATEATRDVTFDNWIINPLGTALAIFIQ